MFLGFRTQSYQGGSPFNVELFGMWLAVCRNTERDEIFFDKADDLLVGIRNLCDS